MRRTQTPPLPTARPRSAVLDPSRHLEAPALVAVARPRALLCAALVVFSFSPVACGDDDAAPPADSGTGADATAPPDAGPTDAGGDPDAGGGVGTVEPVATLAGNSEGIALGHTAGGEPVLYVGLLAQSEIVAVAPDGTATHVADVPRPLGIAVRADGDLVVCGKSDETDTAAGAVWRVSPTDGTATPLVESPAEPLSNPNFVAIAPDGSLLFSDNAANRVYRADADGGGLSLVTDAFTYPNGIAFAPDGATAYVSSWDTAVVYRLSFDAASGMYGAPEEALTDVTNVDGIVVAADGALVLVSNPEGILLVEPGSTEVTEIAPPRGFGLPANGAFGEGAYGDDWLYVSNLLGARVARVRIGRPGLALPVAP